jgi:hypothetical protein
MRTETTKTSAAANAPIIMANTKSLEPSDVLEGGCAGSASHAKPRLFRRGGVLLDLRGLVPLTVLAAEALARIAALCSCRSGRDDE